MKKSKLAIIMSLCMLVILSIMGVTGNAAQPMEGQIVDGSVLTSDHEAFDSRPLIPENPFEDGIMPFGSYLSNGTVTITDQGGGTIYMAGTTYCYRICDSVKVSIHLERLSNGSWYSVASAPNTAYNNNYASVGMYQSVARGYYYRVRGGHVATKGSAVESNTSYTNAIYIG